MVDAAVRLELDAKSLNGESPRWSVREQKLYWVDTREPALHVYDPASGHDMAWEMPSWISCQVLTDRHLRERRQSACSERGKDVGERVKPATAADDYFKKC